MSKAVVRAVLWVMLTISFVGTVVRIAKPAPKLVDQGPPAAEVAAAGGAAAAFVQGYLTYGPGITNEAVKVTDKGLTAMTWPVSVSQSGTDYAVTVAAKLSDGRAETWRAVVYRAGDGWRARGYPQLLPDGLAVKATVDSGDEAPPAVAAMLEGFFRSYLEGQKPEDVANYLRGLTLQPLGGALRYAGLEVSVQGQNEALVRVKAEDPQTQAVMLMDYRVALVSDGDRFLVAGLH